MSVTIEAVIVIGIFAVIWGWIAYEIHRAPTCDKDGNITSSDDFKEMKEDVE